MAFGTKLNRHDAWNAHIAAKAALILDFGLPTALFKTEQAFADFLTTGHRADIDIHLEELSDEQFARLFHFVTSRFDCDAAYLTAMEKRRLHPPLQ